MPRSVVMSVGCRGGGSERGLVGFLWGPPEASGGSRSWLSKDFWLLLMGQIRGSARVAGWVALLG